MSLVLEEDSISTFRSAPEMFPGLHNFNLFSSILILKNSSVIVVIAASIKIHRDLND